MIVVSGTKCNASDLSDEFEFQTLSSLVEEQDSGVGLELQGAGGNDPSDGTLGQGGLVTMVDDMLCGELPAKPV